MTLELIKMNLLLFAEDLRTMRVREDDPTKSFSYNMYEQ